MGSLGKVRVEDAAAGRGTQVQVVTLDAFFASHLVDFVAMLKIDTEGFDATVIYGKQDRERETIGTIADLGVPL